MELYGNAAFIDKGNFSKENTCRRVLNQLLLQASLPFFLNDQAED